MAATAGRVLDRCRALVGPALRDRVARLHDWPAGMAGYAFGWNDAEGRPESGRAAGGKGLRQALAVLCAEAAGAPGAVAVDAAVAVELAHTFSLLHDDIMDGDETRRGRPSLWAAYGTGPAVLAGDALLALAFEVLADAPHGGAAVRRLARDLRELVAGQSDDLLFEGRPWTGPEAVDPAAYTAMAERKTGALLGCAAALGALLAGAPAATVEALSAAGRDLGTAFQIQDDVLGLWGDPEVTGKPVGADLRRGKKTLPVLAALAGPAPAADRLAALLTADGAPDGDRLRRALELVEAAGGRDAALAEADHRLGRARRRLGSVPLRPEPAAELLALLPFAVGRSG
ncbi:polyprenyl synthetase family protein [Streptomyces sp. LP05-1]|uniref:Polyprenyl synthetase family protein n=1 Tax=Streptomyces pyxinae TaxID=2970734 RepID=A0ABT2CLV3_9ACTN|nr:polyprenyl synthetase family protein [Streptomyces sp. LP05-1]MCS0638413.1 polyprenyl synthetase family protein [Streptomyces sp. LP05-1]